jgi:hypothetical protein
MPRSYYKEPDVKYGRPNAKIATTPPDFFRNYDEEMKRWDARRFLRELMVRQGKHDWELGRAEWEDQPPYVRGIPMTDPDEINKFLVRPPPVSQIGSIEDAQHALRLGMILIAVDRNTPDLAQRLNDEAKAIRKMNPLPIKKQPGRPSDSTDVAGFGARKIEQWRAHRIVSLHELRLKGYDPCKKRKELAAWMFPEHKDQRKRGQMLDRSVELLDEALAAQRVLDAQTR